MTEKFSFKPLIGEAQEALKGNTKKIVLTLLGFILIAGTLAGILAAVVPLKPLIPIITVPLYFGYLSAIMGVITKKKGGYGLFFGFSTKPIYLKTLVIFIPTLIIKMVVAIATSLVLGMFMFGLLGVPSSYIGTTVIILVCLTVIGTGIITVLYVYANAFTTMAYFSLIDNPEQPFKVLIKRAWTIAKAHPWRISFIPLFVNGFIAYLIIGIITIGIGSALRGSALTHTSVPLSILLITAGIVSVCISVVYALIIGHTAQAIYYLKEIQHTEGSSQLPKSEIPIA
jgi:hypothetical protein